MIQHQRIIEAGCMAAAWPAADKGLFLLAAAIMASLSKRGCAQVVRPVACSIKYGRPPICASSFFVHPSGSPGIIDGMPGFFLLMSHSCHVLPSGDCRNCCSGPPSMSVKYATTLSLCFHPRMCCFRPPSESCVRYMSQ